MDNESKPLIPMSIYMYSQKRDAYNAGYRRSYNMSMGIISKEDFKDGIHFGGDYSSYMQGSYDGSESAKIDLRKYPLMYAKYRNKIDDL